MLADPEPLIYSNYITIDFDYCRITGTGKKCETGEPDNLGLILKHITILVEVRIVSIYYCLTLGKYNSEILQICFMTAIFTSLRIF